MNRDQIKKDIELLERNWMLQTGDDITRKRTLLQESYNLHIVIFPEIFDKKSIYTFQCIGANIKTIESQKTYDNYMMALTDGITNLIKILKLVIK